MRQADLMMEFAAVSGAIDHFSQCMEFRMNSKTLEGYKGWSPDDKNSITTSDIRERLVDKTKRAIDGGRLALIDVANYAMMLYIRGEYNGE